MKTRYNYIHFFFYLDLYMSSITYAIGFFFFRCCHLFITYYISGIILNLWVSEFGQETREVKIVFIIN